MEPIKASCLSPANILSAEYELHSLEPALLMSIEKSQGEGARALSLTFWLSPNLTARPLSVADIARLRYRD